MVCHARQTLRVCRQERRRDLRDFLVSDCYFLFRHDVLQVSWYRQRRNAEPELGRRLLRVPGEVLEKPSNKLVAGALGRIARAGGSLFFHDALVCTVPLVHALRPRGALVALAILPEVACGAAG